ncbi:MAG TPA: hypothetical protein VGD37_43100 [Kofleriaceae bacterium]
MSKLQLLPVVAAVLAATVAHAEPARAVSPPPPDIREQDRQLAAEFADALALPPIHQHALRFDSLIEFQPGSTRVYSRDREKLMAVAAAWRDRGRWTTITVESYGSDASLARRRADKIRSYLTRYGIAAELIVATTAARAGGGGVDLTIALCDPSSASCGVAGRQRSAQIGI